MGGACSKNRKNISAYRIYMWKLEVKKPLGRLSIDGSIILK